MISKNNISTEGLENFEWPEYNSDSKRIKAYSKKFKDMSIAEAFSNRYNLDLPNDIMTNTMINDVPCELSVGSIINVKILSVSKNKVIFDGGNLKANLQSNVNLYKYDFFKNYTPNYSIKALVTDVQKDRATIDPIKPMINDWINPILKEPKIQKQVLDIRDHDADKRVLMGSATPIKVKNLQLTRGGFMGKAVIPNVSKFVGEDYTIDAFIPGSQIVLNITDNFEKFIGCDVDAFVLNYIQKSGTVKPGSAKEISLICSTKEYLKYLGEINIINMFKLWCTASEYPEPWNEIAEKTYNGKVTGIINSSKKCGVFVEIPELNITGMVATKPEELVNYKPHDDIFVKITGFEEELYFNAAAQQIQHMLPYEVKDGYLDQCSIKPILVFT